MTDKETLLAMLTRAGIREGERDGWVRAPDSFGHQDAIEIERGYAGFAVLLAFNEDGSLRDIAAYE